MTNYSASDFGFTWSGDTEPPAKTVNLGDIICLKCARGIYAVRVMRLHRDSGYYETVFERWITEVPAYMQSSKGGIEVMSRDALLAAKYAA